MRTTVTVNRFVPAPGLIAVPAALVVMVSVLFSEARTMACEVLFVAVDVAKVWVVVPSVWPFSARLTLPT